MLCRLCLKDSTTAQNVINSNLKCAELTLIESLYWIFGVEVDINDPYSKYICARCETVVQYIGSYRTLYQRNQLVLEGKLDIQADFEEWIDPVEITYGDEQLTDTAATDTSDEPEINLKREERRRELIRYYYEIPTTAIRELIMNQTDRPTNSDDTSLFQVNEVVNVEVCKYCSEIFKAKGPLQAHYNTKHKSAENRLKLKQLRKKRKNLLTWHRGKGGTFYKKLVNRYSAFDELLDPTNNKNNFFFDVTHFPNLNFAKQLDTLTKKKTALKTTDRSTRDSNSERIITVKITDNNCHDKWLDLKDFCISLERCAIPEEFHQATDETEHSLAKGAIPDSAAVNVTEIQAINSNNISSTLLRWAQTLNEKLTERETNRKQISSIKNAPETENNYESCEDSNSDDDTHIPDDYDCLSDDTESTQNDISNPHQLPVTKDVCIPLQRCEVPTQTKRAETEHWKKQISKRVLKLQQIISTDFDPERVKIERERERLEIVSDASEDVIPVEIVDSEVQIQTIKIGNNQNLTPFQRTKLKLKDAYVSVERCQLPHDFYQDGQEKENNLFHKISENGKKPQRWKMNVHETLFKVKGIAQEYQRKKQHTTTNDLETQSENTLNKVPETSKIPQQPQKWTTNVYETLFKVKGIAEEFEKTKQNKTDLRTQSENTVDNEKPLKENCEEELRKRSIYPNRRKSLRISQTKRSDMTHCSTNFSKTDHPIRGMQIVIPNIDSFLRENGYILHETSEQNKRDERRDSTTSNCMPQLENEIKCVTRLRDTLDEPPKLEPQVLPTNSKKRTIKNINTEKNLKLNPPKRRKKVNCDTGVADELGQVTASLKLIKLRDSSDSDWTNKKLNMFGGLSVNNWMDRVFRNDNLPDQSIDLENLINANFLDAANDLDGKESGIEVDDKIKEKNIPHCLHKEEKDLDNPKAIRDNDACLIHKDMEDSNLLKSDADGKFQMKTWKHQISNILLKLTGIKGSSTTEQVNSEICLKETDVTETHKDETPTRLNVPEESTSLIAKSNILPHSDENSCQISNDDFGNEKDDSGNTRNIQGTNSQWCNQSETNIANEQLSHQGCQNSCQISNDDVGNEKDDSGNTCNIQGSNSQWCNQSETNIANEQLSDPSSSSIPVKV